MTKLFGTMLALVAMTGAARADLDDDDLIVTGESGTRAFVWVASGNNLTTVVTLPNPVPGGMTMSEDNRNLVIPTWNPANGNRTLFNVNARGNVSTLFSLPTPGREVTDVVWHDQRYWVTSFDNQCHRYDPSTRTYSTLDLGYFSSGVARDPARRQLIFNMCSRGRLYRWGRRSGFSTLASGWGQGSSVRYHPQSGSYIITTFSGIERVSSTGVRTTLHQAPGWPKAVSVNRRTGTFTVSSGSTIYSFDANGTLVQTRQFANGPRMIRGLQRFGWRRFGTRRTSTRSQRFRITMNRSAGHRYQVALSQSTRPGIPVAGRRIQLNPDDLMIASLQPLPGVTSGFSGTLDQNGEATATLTAPPGTPSGLTIFASVIAFNPNEPGGIETANTIGTTLVE